MRYLIYTLIWRDIEIEVRYCANNYNAIAHLEIEAIKPPRERLPMTKTGYRSYFHAIGTIEKDYGGNVVACVMDWLNTSSKEKAWLNYVEATRQGRLF